MNTVQDIPPDGRVGVVSNVNPHVTLFDQVLPEADLAGSPDCEAAVESQGGVRVLTVAPGTAVYQVPAGETFLLPPSLPPLVLLTCDRKHPSYVRRSRSRSCRCSCSLSSPRTSGSPPPPDWSEPPAVPPSGGEVRSDYVRSGQEVRSGLTCMPWR